MEDEPFVKMRYAFRFLRLDLGQAERIASQFPGSKVRGIPDTPDFSIAVSVSEETNLDWIEDFVHDEGLAEEQYDFFISTLTDTDSRIVSMPTNMVNLLRKIGGSVEFSFTVV